VTFLGDSPHAQKDRRYVFSVMTEPATKDGVILLVDDNPDDIFLTKRAFGRAGIKHVVKSVGGGAETIAYLAGDAPYDDRVKYPLPALVLLDIKMPAINGFEVLRWLRRQPHLAHLCVVMLTSSDDLKDVNLAYMLGAKSFLVKPLSSWNATDLAHSLENLLAMAGSK
jgi:CheY-like chemotaxis protein